MHPSYGADKSYHVWVQGQVSEQVLQSLRTGVVLEDGVTAPAKVEVVKGIPTRRGVKLLELQIHEGRNRQVRRMCEAVGLIVVALERIRFGSVSLDQKMQQGDYRNLTEREIKALRTKVGLSR